MTDLPETPQAPKGDMNVEAIQINEAFMSYVNAGFTRAEALTLMMHHLAINTYVAAGLPLYSAGGTK